MTTRRRKRHNPEQVVRKLRDADAILYSGKELAAVPQSFGPVEKVRMDFWFRSWLMGVIGGMAMQARCWSSKTSDGLTASNKVGRAGA